MSGPPAKREAAALSALTDFIQYGYTAKSSSSAKGPKYLRITDIQDDRVDWTSVPHVHIAFKDLSRYRLQPGDIVFARSGATVGKSFLIRDDPGEAVFASYLIRVRCTTGCLEPRYAALYFKSEEYWRQIRDGATGTGQPNFNGSKLAELRVPTRPIKEQRDIAARLEALLRRSKNAREQLARIPRLIVRYKQAILAAAFRGDLTDDNPRKWHSLKLGDLIAGIDAGKNIRCEERPPRPDEKGIVKISSVTWGEFNPVASKTAMPGADIDDESLIKPGDFLISRANTLELVGACVIVKSLSTPNLYLSDKVLRLRFSQSIQRWVLFFLRSDEGRRQIQELATGNQLSMRNISQSAIRAIRLPLPSEEIRDQILNRIDDAFTAMLLSLGDVMKADEFIDRLDQATLDKAFRGRDVRLVSAPETSLAGLE